MPPFLDTNIFLRHLLQDHSVLSPVATNLIWRIEQGEIQAKISDIVVFETVFTLQRSYKRGRDEIVASLLPLIELPGILLPGKRRFRSAFDLYRKGGLGFADCYHLTLMRQERIREILSFDTDFDGIEGIVRIQG